MFLSESLAVDVPLAVAQHRLLRFLRVGDLDAVARTAYEEGATIFTRAGIGGLAKTIAVKSLPPTQPGVVTVVAIRWLATGHLSGAFPVLDANLEMSADDSRTNLTIIGSYRTPLGKLGETIDRLVLKSVAQATIRNFLGQLSEIATELAPSPRASHSQLGSLEPEEP